jgi:hypothetical protein
MPKKMPKTWKPGTKIIYEHMRMVAKSFTTKRMLETQ